MKFKIQNVAKKGTELITDIGRQRVLHKPCLANLGRVSDGLVLGIADKTIIVRK